MKINASGEKEWEKTYGRNSRDVLYFMISTSDDGYLLGGSSESDIGQDKSEPVRGYNNSDYWIIKIDVEGNQNGIKHSGEEGMMNLQE